MIKIQEHYMTLYNPFKPHIVQFPDGKFGVRKLGLIVTQGWAYLDMSGKEPCVKAVWLYAPGNHVAYCKTSDINFLKIRFTESKKRPKQVEFFSSL